ncbi:GGDEF domain-containing protein [Ureibacillus thermophilus]|uniref:GGDEF domain-containing protein n=1 Tax=Ureibacillus thermophilus TaxID=367743 RepID=UPI00360BBDA8
MRNSLIRFFSGLNCTHFFFSLYALSPTSLTSLVKNFLQPADLFGRWGGEEFIIILKDKTLLEATELAAEKLRNIIENHSFRFAGHMTFPKL